MTTDPMLLARVLDNMLSNGQRHALHVWLRACADEKTLQLCIEDNGLGLPSAGQDLLALSRTSGGLGLAIIDALMRHLQGQ